MNYIRDNNIISSSINGEFYKIFVNLDKNKIPELVSYIVDHDKSERNDYFQKEFQSSFTSFNSYLCEKN